MEKTLQEYRDQISSDCGLKEKRRNLVILSSILIALNYTGAMIKEANTFLFKIEFTDKNGINEIFIISLCYLLLRYYAYAQEYHNKLMKLWSRDMLSDRKVFYCDPVSDNTSGLISDCLPWAGDEPGVQSPDYLISGVFQRSLSYPKKHIDDDGEEIYYDEIISCTHYTNTWKLPSYLKLLAYEMKYQLKAYFKSREQLDLLGPYFLGCFALILTVSKLPFWS